MEEKAEGIGRRQVLLLLLLSCHNSIVSINHTLPAFQGYTPHFFCQVDNVSVTVDGCVTQLNSSVVQNEHSCPHGYQFQSDRGDSTVVTEWQLVCERRYLSPLIATIYFCGVTLGAIVCGMLADRYGRYPVVLTCLYVQGLLGASLYFTKNLETFMGIRFVQGFFVQGMQGITFALLIELFPAKFRTLVAVVFEVYWSVGSIYLAGASYLVPQWRTLELVLSIPTAATLFYVCLIPESPRWLALHGKPEEAQKLWKKILQHENNVIQNVNASKKNSISEYVGSTSEPALHNTTQKENSTMQCTSKRDSCKSVVQIVINNIHVDSNISDKGIDTGTQMLTKETGKDGNQIASHQEDVRSLNDGIKCRCQRNVKSDDTKRTNNHKGIQKEGLVIQACEVYNGNQINNAVGMKTDCDKTYRNENIPAETDIDESIGSCTCQVNLELNRNKVDDVQKNQEPKAANLLIDNGSINDDPNHLWKEIVKELGYDVEHKLQDLSGKSDNIKIQYDQDGGLSINETPATGNAKCLDIVAVKNIGKRENDAVQESSAINTAHKNSFENSYSKDLKQKTTDLDMDHVDIIYSSTTSNSNSLQRNSVSTPNSKSEKEKTGILQLFRNNVLRKYNLIMIFVWFSIALSYYGILFHLPGLTGERHLNFFIGALVEAFSFLLAYIILSRYGRRLPLTGYSLISGFACLGVAIISVLHEDTVSWIGNIQTALALLGKSSALGAFCTMFLYASELFPTVLRGVAMGHCGFWARVGSLTAPQLIFLGEFTLPAVPLLILSGLGILAGLSVLFLPETLGQQLPDTIEDAVKLDRKKCQIQKGTMKQRLCKLF